MSDIKLYIDKNINRSYTEASACVHPSLTEHSKTFSQGIYRINEIFYLAVGYGISNVTMIVGDDGVIIIDTGESITSAEEIMEDFRKITDLPIKAVIYTHNHLDHVGGVKGFVSKEEVEMGHVEIIAHEKLMEGIMNTASLVGPIINLRAVYSFGLVLETGDKGHVNDGLGPKMRVGQTTFLPPTITFNDILEVKIAGIDILLVYAPSETDDEIFIYFPKYEVVQTADIIMGETYPNIHTIRGTKYRDPIQWYESIDKIRYMNPKYMLPSHGRPIEGSEKIYEMLTAYRDSIQFTHDQTIRYMNKGYTPDELVERIPHLPDHLRNHKWLQEYYGTVKHSVRQIYQGYMGWFNGDPTTLDPLYNKERAHMYIEAMGGRGKMLENANNNISNNRWVAELMTYLIVINPCDEEARLIKANAFRQLGYETMNTNWRNWYITAARELDRTLDYSIIERLQGVDSRDIVSEIPVSMFLKGLCVRIDSIKAKNAHIIAVFKIVETGEEYALEIRRGIVEYHGPGIENVSHKVYTKPPSVTNGDQFNLGSLDPTGLGMSQTNDNHIIIEISDILLRKVFMRKLKLGDLIKNGDALLKLEWSTMKDVETFFGYFDLENKSIYPNLTAPNLL